VINILEVGEGPNALMCITDKPGCCQVPKQGEWFYPNNTAVGVKITNHGFYRNRTEFKVLLHRRNGIIQPDGFYCCEVSTMDTPSINSRICIFLFSGRFISINVIKCKGGGYNYTPTCMAMYAHSYLVRTAFWPAVVK